MRTTRFNNSHKRWALDRIYKPFVWHLAAQASPLDERPCARQRARRGNTVAGRSIVSQTRGASPHTKSQVCPRRRLPGGTRRESRLTVLLPATVKKAVQLTPKGQHGHARDGLTAGVPECISLVVWQSPLDIWPRRPKDTVCTDSLFWARR